MGNGHEVYLWVDFYFRPVVMGSVVSLSERKG